MKIKRKNINSHRSAECEWEIIHCPYSNIGCVFKSPKCKIPDHKATSNDYHLELSVALIMKQKEQQEEQMKQLMKQMEQQEEQMKQLRRQNEQLVNQKEQFTKQQAELTKNIVTLEHEKPHWITMTRFSWFKAEKREWYSAGFYTHIRGYKLCLRVDANGYDEGVGHYVSTYLCLTEGEFDAYLTWPMTCECTITLRNQLKDEDHHSGTFTLTINDMYEPKSAMFFGENGSRRGYHKFIAHNLLDRHMFKQCKYLIDDTLCFKVQVKII